MTWLAKSMVEAVGHRRDHSGAPPPCAALLVWLLLTSTWLGCDDRSASRLGSPVNPTVAETPRSSQPAPDFTSPQLTYPEITQVYHTGCCDGSAGVALDDEFFLVGNDENSVLRVYARNGSRGPVMEVNFRKYLDLKKKDDESDIEGMTLIGTEVYVIASHARSKDGEKRKGRRQLFGLTYSSVDGQIQLRPFGKPFTKLHKALEEAQPIPNLDFEESAKSPGDLPGGLNIEGLSSTPSGTLLIGFRSPIVDGRTILIELKNPREILLGSEPRFGDAHQLLLGGTGIRAFERFETTYLFTTEARNGKGRPYLFSWDGQSQSPRRVFASLPKNSNPESLLLFPTTGLSEIHLLSDDGNETIRDRTCNDLKPSEERRFRRIILSTHSDPNE